jgi:hypothetical protein
MTKFIIRRTLGLIPLLIGVVIISFLLMKAAPGGPQAQFQGNKRITQEQIDAWLKRWCLQPTDANTAITQQVGNYFIEFGGWFGILNCERDGAQAFFSNQGGLNILPAALGGGSNGVIHGDLGYGIQSGRPVTELIAERIPATLILAGTALVLWISIAILLGVYAAVHRYSLFDQTSDLLQLCLLLVADVLARPEPDLHLRRRVALVSERRDHHDPQLASVRHAPVLGGLRGGPGPGHRRYRLASVFAGPLSGRGEHRRRQPVRPGVDARIDQPGLRPNGQGQGVEVPGGHRQARLP